MKTSTRIFLALLAIVLLGACPAVAAYASQQTGEPAVTMLD